MDEQQYKPPPQRFYRRWWSNIKAAAVATAHAGKKFVRNHPKGFRYFTAGFEFVAAIFNAYALGKVIDAYRDNPTEDIADLSTAAFSSMLPWSFFCGACAVLTHLPTNEKYQKDQSQDGLQENLPLMASAGPKELSTGRKIYIGILIVGDSGDHWGSFVSTGVLFVRQVADKLLALHVKRIIYSSIMGASLVGIVAEVRVCKKNLIDHYKGIDDQSSEEEKADFFTWYTLFFSGLMALTNCYSTYGLTLDSIFGTEPIFLGLGGWGWFGFAGLGLFSGVSNVLVHFAQDMAYQSASGFKASNIELNNKGLALNYSTGAGDFSSHVATYSGTLIQVRTKLLPNEKYPPYLTIPLDLFTIGTAMVACISETGMCMEEKEKFYKSVKCLRKHSLFAHAEFPESSHPPLVIALPSEIPDDSGSSGDENQENYQPKGLRSTTLGSVN